MPNVAKTDRQKRETDFYKRYAEVQKVSSIDFAPVQGRERRPWNPYWFVYELARNRFLNDGQRLLDLGCGIGIASVRLAYLGYQVDGVDLSEPNVHMARGLAKRYQLDQKCCFHEMLAEDLAFTDNCFDLVVGIDVLHHVEVPQAITQVHRVLKPGGVAIFKEHVSVPVLDPIRNTNLFRTIAPKDASLEHHITEDERKLTDTDLDMIHATFDIVQTERFTLASRLDRIIPACTDSVRGRLQRLDRHLLRACPSLATLGGTAVLICHKAS